MLVKIVAPLNKIQALRASHAISEAGATLSVDRQAARTLRYLNRFFDIPYRTNHPDATPLSFEIDHKTPRTSVLDISRSLLFPHAIPDLCLAKWASRELRVTFCGLITPARQQTLADWLKHHGHTDPAVPITKRRNFRLNRLPWTRGRRPTLRNYGDFYVWSSERGRVLPAKAWDDAYYDSLARSQFVLCPTGDHIWSYRFFEAVLCGAIPIVEAPCTAYEGFVYSSLDQEIPQWSEDLAMFNFRLALQRLTAPTVQLHESLRRSLDGAL